MLLPLKGQAFLKKAAHIIKGDQAYPAYIPGQPSALLRKALFSKDKKMHVLIVKKAAAVLKLL